VLELTLRTGNMHVTCLYAHFGSVDFHRIGTVISVTYLQGVYIYYTYIATCHPPFRK